MRCACASEVRRWSQTWALSWHTSPLDRWQFFPSNLIDVGVDEQIVRELQDLLDSAEAKDTFKVGLLIGLLVDVLGSTRLQGVASTSARVLLE